MIANKYRRAPNEQVSIERIGDAFVATLSNGLEVRKWVSRPCPNGIGAEIILTEMHWTVIGFGFRPVGYSE